MLIARKIKTAASMIIVIIITLVIVLIEADKFCV